MKIKWQDFYFKKTKMKKNQTIKETFAFATKNVRENVVCLIMFISKPQK